MIASSSRPPLSSSAQPRDHYYQSHPSTHSAPVPAPVKAVTKPDKGKLTEQWGSPPTVITREPGGNLIRGDLLGEGGFARVYLATEADGTEKAVKVIAKEQLKSTKNKSKLFGEIKIHQAMLHPNIISFEHCFEDDGNVYMQLELCANGSLLDLLRRRRRYTEPEARYYLVQLIGACDYMHSNSVIHRDLKLGNLMLDAQMKLKVGDFGLAALVKFPGERKKTICGTPNYIAPEILFDQNNGHSFEVDIWSIGVILYTLLVGKPPFQTKDVKNIYRKIKELNYEFPSTVAISPEATNLIEQILTVAPDQRPTLPQILAHPFFTSGPFPSHISLGAMDSTPSYSSVSIRASARNFEAVKRECGITSPTVLPLNTAVGGNGKALLAVVEEVEMSGMTGGGGGLELAAKGGMEREVRNVLQPGSPISDLLRSARKPLVISPHAEPREILQRKLVADVARNTPATTAALPPTTSRSRSNSVSKENQPLQTTTTTREEQRERGGQRKAAMAVNHEVVMEEITEQVERMGLPEKQGHSKHHPARELYHSTHLALQAALTISTTAQLEALPSPAAVAPRVFLTSWVDYTHKYGTAYSFTDASAGVLFNDSTSIVLSADRIHFDYISNKSSNIYTRRPYSTLSHPVELERKVYLANYFEEYMRQTLTRDSEWAWRDEERKRGMVFLIKYYRGEKGILFKLSNEVLQFNFYDHTKLILTASGSIITYIDAHFNLTTHSLHSLFHEASRLGFYRTSRKESSGSAGAEARRERLEAIRGLVSKLEYASVTLRDLSLRKSTPPAGGA